VDHTNIREPSKSLGPTASESGSLGRIDERFRVRFSVLDGGEKGTSVVRVAARFDLIERAYGFGYPTTATN
jgi:hypothetical protein